MKIPGEEQNGSDHGVDHEPHVNRRTRWVFIGFVLVAAYFLVTEHRAHFVALLPYLLFLACPLMHLFHHHGHHRHRTGMPRSSEERHR